jgi:hypothetical protein
VSSASAALYTPGPQGLWQLEIGDPSLLGWLTVVGYFAASWLCGRTAWLLRARSQHAGRGAWFWAVLAILLALGGINKQLDLQSLLTGVGRTMAVAQGWYDQRRVVQAAFVGTLLVAGTVTLGTLAWVTRGYGAPARLALVGSVGLTVFVVIRASSFHRVDHLIGVDLLGLRVNWVLELGGIACVGLAGWQEAHSQGTARVAPRRTSTRYDSTRHE